MPQGAGFDGAKRSGGNPNGGARGGTGGNAPGRVGNATVADHMIANGQIGAPSIGKGGVAQGNYATKDDAYNDYARAVGGFATRGTLGKVADFMAGPFFDQNEPMAGNPRSFSGGTFHTSSNPAGAIAAMAGLASGVPMVGSIVGKGYQMAGGPMAWHGGYEQPDIRTGPLGNAPAGYDMGGSFGDLNRPGASPGAPGQPGRPGSSDGNRMAGFGSQVATAPGGAPMGAQPAAPASPMQAFAGAVPNHSLPQGYTSLFPNSLTPADKAALYARALGGMA